MSLRDEIEAAIARFKLVEPVTMEDMATIQKHLRFALGGDAKVDVFRLMPTEPLFVVAWRNGQTARTTITVFTSPEDARARGTASPRS